MLLQYLQTDRERNIFGRIAANLFFIQRRLLSRLWQMRQLPPHVCLQTKLSEKVK